MRPSVFSKKQLGVGVLLHGITLSDVGLANAWLVTVATIITSQSFILIMYVNAMLRGRHVNVQKSFWPVF